MPDQSPLAFALILAGVAALGLILAGRDLLRLHQWRANGDCTQCGLGYTGDWPTRRAPSVRRDAYHLVAVCPRCGTAREA
jgi:rubredoxin